MAEASATGQYGPGRVAADIIGRADLKLGERVKPVLEALQAASPNRFRGLRHSVGWNPHSEVEDREIHEKCEADPIMVPPVLPQKQMAFGSRRNLNRTTVH